jgi:FG-GAP-like repeat
VLGRRRLPLASLLTFAVLMLLPRGVAALPQLRIGDRLDAPALYRLVPSADRLQIRVAVGADIDADGDVDLVAATDRDVVIWINDGRGQFRRRAAHRHPIADGPPAPGTWSGDGYGAAEAVQTGAVLLPLIVVRAHAPPIDPASKLLFAHAVAHSDVCLTSRTPRAPPAVLI